MASDSQQQKPIRGRYAPSPSGPLHLGNLRTALLAWLQMRLLNGVFVMRMEDLDRPRTKAGAAEHILADLRWLGLDWDEGPDVGGAFGPYVQSARNDRYELALRQLQDRELAYPCICSRKDIREAVRAPHGPLGPVYPGTCSQRYGHQLLETNLASGRKPAWRCRVAAETISFEDGLAGPQHQDLPREVGDFVVRRSDGLFAYQLAVVVDDGEMAITHVLRGLDLLDSTPRQIALMKRLGFAVPEYWHVPLVRDKQGRRMAKRDGSLSVESYRAGGGNAPSLIGEMAASLGLIEGVRSVSAQQLLRDMDYEHLQTQLRKDVIRDLH